MAGRVKYDDPDWSEAASHLGECAIGSVHELRESNPPGKPFEPERGPLGFCVDPAAYRVKTRKRRKK